MTVNAGSRDFAVLCTLTLLYAAASLLHFAHNAEYLADYPNLPASFTRAGVYGAWLAVAAIGAAGLALVRFGRPSAGLALLGIYAALGFDGLLHYTRAPIADHTTGMNATIGFEVAAAAALFFFVVNAATRRLLGELLDP
jgi:hypothetical protein